MDFIIKFKDMETKQTKIVSSDELKKCPKMILSAAHWIPKHKVEECGGHDENVMPRNRQTQVVFHQKLPIKK